MSLFVGNVSKHVSLKQLQGLFKKYGKCKIDLRDRYAFVQFENDNHGQAAKKQLQHETFHGLQLNIQWSKNSGRFGENNKRKNGGDRRRSRSRENNNSRWRREDGRGRSHENDRRGPSYSGNKNIEDFEIRCPRDEIILERLRARVREYENRYGKGNGSSSNSTVNNNNNNNNTNNNNNINKDNSRQSNNINNDVDDGNDINILKNDENNERMDVEMGNNSEVGGVVLVGTGSVIEGRSVLLNENVNSNGNDGDEQGMVEEDGQIHTVG